MACSHALRTMDTEQQSRAEQPPEARSNERRDLEDYADSLLDDEDTPDLRFALVATFAIALAGALLVLTLL